MRLKSVELLGFKSFAKKSKLDFTVPVTGIVGPNGSGKSNVVEAFRFVLGEQSMKSLRGKSGKDLIFKGSKDLPKGSRAYVEIVFDNKDKIFRLGDRSEPINLDFEEISLKREVFADGANNYYINNHLVRLKDIIELLASVNIGSSSHHIISQGQADRILSASAKDRRIMIEDALGLKVFQYKIKDASKKLEKSAEHMKEVMSIRRELAPHIKYLKKQVEKLEKGEELRRELSSLYLSYFKNESTYLKDEDINLKNKIEENEKLLKETEVKLKAFKIETRNEIEVSKNNEIVKLQQEFYSLEKIKEDLSRKLGRIEGMIEFENKNKSSSSESISIKITEIKNLIKEAGDSIDNSLNSQDVSSIKENLKKIKSILDNFGQRFLVDKKEEKPISFKDLEETKNDVLLQLEEVDRSKNILQSKIQEKRQEIEKHRQNALDEQQERFNLETERNRYLNESNILQVRLESFKSRKINFENDIKEAVSLIGQNILNYSSFDGNVSFNHDEVKKQIERIKIRLEDVGTAGGADTLKEYQDITDRDNFLSNELADIEKSIANLKQMIDDLKKTLEEQFKNGLNNINVRFEEFFKLMFGGGSAYLSLVTQDAKRNNISEEDEEGGEELILDDENALDQGIEINVTLPHKKVKDLHMLSGGERSLTSIALVFAVTQVNPPPFLVLDETDAALDEANSKRYGDMIEKLSKYSQLLVVTHNRETMSRADIIYGVTIGADGGSKLLSIKFQEAENYAK